MLGVLGSFGKVSGVLWGASWGGDGARGNHGKREGYTRFSWDEECWKTDSTQLQRLSALGSWLADFQTATSHNQLFTPPLFPPESEEKCTSPLLPRGGGRGAVSSGFPDLVGGVSWWGIGDPVAFRGRGEDKERTRRGQGEDKARTRREQGQDKERTRRRRGEDKETRRVRGEDKERTRTRRVQGEDKERKRRGQGEDKERTKS